MRKLFFLIVTGFIFHYGYGAVGSNRNYQILTQVEYDKWQTEGHDNGMSRFFVMPVFDYNVKDIKTTIDPEIRLAKFGYMLRRNISEYIVLCMQDCDTTNSFNYLMLGMYLFSKEQYSESIQILSKFNNPKYNFIAELMIADCKVELLPTKKNLSDIIAIYQSLTDKSVNPQELTILESRIRYYRYHVV